MNNKDEDLKVIAEKLYNSIMRHINIIGLNPVETSKVLEHLIAMLRKHFVNY